MLVIERPIVFIDFESTGTDTQKDRIIEYSFCKLLLDGSRETKTGKLNPGIPIPASATAIHGIKDEDVKDSPTFVQFAKGILVFIDDCDLAGFKSNGFDFPLLYAEFIRCNITWDWRKHAMVDVGNLFIINEPRTLTAAVKFYCGKELEGAHGTEADILATVDVFHAQLEKYYSDDNPQMFIDDLAKISNYDKTILDMAGKFILGDDGRTILLNFGKSKGLAAKDDLGFVGWMLGPKATFPPDTIRIAKAIYYNDHEYLNSLL